MAASSNPPGFPRRSKTIDFNSFSVLKLMIAFFTSCPAGAPADLAGSSAEWGHARGDLLVTCLVGFEWDVGVEEDALEAEDQFPEGDGEGNDARRVTQNILAHPLHPDACQATALRNLRESERSGNSWALICHLVE